MLKIMVVDDDFLICEELRGIVTDLEYEVAGVADSGRAAIEMALDVKPDVILMDIVMENGMDGIEAAEKIMGPSESPQWRGAASGQTTTFGS